VSTVPQPDIRRGGPGRPERSAELVRLSQHANRKLTVVATDIVAEVGAPSGS
jgi:hypothetical protein